MRLALKARCFPTTGDRELDMATGNTNFNRPRPPTFEDDAQPSHAHFKYAYHNLPHLLPHGSCVWDCRRENSGLSAGAADQNSPKWTQKSNVDPKSKEISSSDSNSQRSVSPS
jgi:hypothetical protein